MFEARLVLEVGVAGLAAQHADAEHLAAMAEEVTEMFASLEDPAAFLMHDVRFHRAVASGCGNRVLAALMEMVAAQFYELRKETVQNARDLRESAEMHRRIFRAIRARDADAARLAMTEHLQQGPARPDPRGGAGRTGERAIGGAAWVTPLWI